jgi:hypothetical protein
MSTLIYDIGKNKIANNEYMCRYIYNLKNEYNLSDELKSDELIYYSIEYLRTKHNLDLSNYKFKKIERENKVGFYMKWHIDDCSIYKHKSTDDKINNIKLNEKYSLHHTCLLPKYTMLIYLTGGDNFDGGEFCFIDKTIKPEKYDVFLFDSREVHRVNLLKSGVRKNILIKFYE